MGLFKTEINREWKAVLYFAHAAAVRCTTTPYRATLLVSSATVVVAHFCVLDLTRRVSLFLSF